MSEANKIQVGGSHYKQENGGQEHWDRVWMLGLDYWQACITKYVERCWKKNGIQDLKKARHFLDKYIELHTPPEEKTELDLSSAENMVSSMKGLMVVRIGENGGGGGGGTERQKLQVYFTPGQVLPTGWAQFVFEGVDAGGLFFTCKECKAKFHAPVGSNPHMHHSTCHEIVDSIEDAHHAAEASKAYVNQG